MPSAHWGACGELALCLLAGWQLMRLRRSVEGTTLVDAWRWAWCVVAIAIAVIVIREAGAARGRQFAAGDYVLAVMGLTPLVAVLGARRPTNRVWTPFVICPLVLVLHWPVLSVVLARGWWGGLELETQAVAAFVLVAVMACGNYVGTRLFLAAFSWGVVLCMLILCYTPGFSRILQPEWARLAAGLCGNGALWIADVTWRRLDTTPERFDRLWRDVLNRFGVVWARRLQERLNAAARQQQWPGRLELDGWHWTQPLSAEQQQTIEQTHRWLLRRFVDPKWLDLRLETICTGMSPPPLDS